MKPLIRLIWLSHVQAVWSRAVNLGTCPGGASWQAESSSRMNRRNAKDANRGLDYLKGRR
jgi:hypothetical protein